MKNNAAKISNIAHITVNNLETFRSLALFLLGLKGLYKSSIVDEDNELIDPAIVDIAAANNPAIIIPENGDGNCSIINFGKYFIRSNI